ncbi:MAG: hypothetical protein M2R46_02489 [Verrucomicrobia subdivision 3 bacterium]|nr:hypothetical protein [Limisphaerales bacterium]
MICDLSICGERRRISELRPCGISLRNLFLGTWIFRDGISQKVLGLFRKSNPPLLEWLQSPIVYREELQFCESFNALLRSISRRLVACIIHEHGREIPAELVAAH